MKKQIKDLTGKIFNNIEVLYISHKKGRIYFWNCKCHCGKIFITRGAYISCGHTKSCGCKRYLGSRKTHGMRHTRIYSIWTNMNSRCNNKNTLEYKDYGGRGIKVKRKNFEDFYDDMGSTYKDGLTIDRYPDNNGNYCKENCRRATMKEQQNNRRDNHILIYKGKKQTVAERSYELGINQQTILSRINYGFSIDKILNPSLKIINVK